MNEINEDLVTVADPNCYDTGFTTLPNQIHDSKTLEPLAKLLYWHLERYRTCPGWKMHDSEIRKYLDCGIKVLQRLFRQLTDDGFISYTIEHRNGRIVSKVRHFAPLPIHKGKKKFRTINYNVDRNCPDSNNPDSNCPVLTNTNSLPNTKNNNNAKKAVVDESLIKDMVAIGFSPQAAASIIRNKGGSEKVRFIFEYCRVNHTSNHKAMMNQIIASGTFQIPASNDPLAIMDKILYGGPNQEAIDQMNKNIGVMR